MLRAFTRNSSPGASRLKPITFACRTTSFATSPGKPAGSLCRFTFIAESYPEKTLFGTDLFPGAGELDWEEVGWMTSQNAREALAIALTGMINDGEITRPRALELARMVLRENAQKLYGWEVREQGNNLR